MAECHVAFLPMTTSGHMIPMVDMAVLMASRGVKTTIITDKSSAHRFSKAVEQTIDYNHPITFHIFKYEPPANPYNSLEAILGPQETVELFLEESRPNCIISDVFYAWTTTVAAKFNIPRIIFDPAGFFPKCVGEMIALYEPEKSVSSDSEPFIIPHLPHTITLTNKEMPPKFDQVSGLARKLQSEAEEAYVMSYGTIVNSFYELEPDYVRHYRELVKRKAWHIGMVSLCCKNTERGGKSDIDEHEISKWLDSKSTNSVVYISFGTLTEVVSSQVYEIAMGLEASNHDFIWVIKNKDQETSLPLGFKERMKEKRKGLIIKGSAPQLLILDHVSVGGFVTHIGCNSMLEGICGGVAMVTWPVNVEQFYNAKLVTDVLKIGVSIGDGEWKSDPIVESMKREAIQKALGRIMSPEEGYEMRRRAQILKQNAKAAIKEGGSSYLELTAFIEEMKAIKSKGFSYKKPT